MKIKISLTDDKNQIWVGEINLDKTNKKNPNSRIKPIKNKENNYKGLTGGINLLIKNKFFDKPKSVAKVQNKLNDVGYFYPIESTDSQLRDRTIRDKKNFTRLKIDKKWNYVVKK